MFHSWCRLLLCLISADSVYLKLMNVCAWVGGFWFGRNGSISVFVWECAGNVK